MALQKAQEARNVNEGQAGSKSSAKEEVRPVESGNKQAPKVVVSAPEPSQLLAAEASQECAPQSREVARSVATQAVDEVVCTVAANLTKTEAAGKSPSTTFAEEREAPKGSAPSARKKFAAKLLSAAKDGSLEKSLKDFESEA